MGALTGKYPPKIRMYSKYERRTDTRSYDDRKKMYEGGWEVVRAEHLEGVWKEKYDEGARDHPENSPSGLERDPERRRESQRPQRVRKEKRLLQLKKRIMKKKRRKKRNMMRRKNKFIFKNIVNNL